MQQTNAGRVQQKENTTEVAGRMQQQLQEEGCIEKGESKQCNRNSRKNEVFEMEERVVNNAIEKIGHNAIQ